MLQARIYSLRGNDVDVRTNLYKTEKGLDKAIKDTVRNRSNLIIEVFQNGKQKSFTIV